jgi:uncharacterized protein YdeI (YjbR/CyaY-like superfamily)
VPVITSVFLSQSGHTMNQTDAISFITIDNVRKVSALLMNSDFSLIKHYIRQDAQNFVDGLKMALDNFDNTENPIDTFYLAKEEALLQAARNLYNILTDDAKESFKHYFSKMK